VEPFAQSEIVFRCGVSNKHAPNSSLFVPRRYAFAVPIPQAGSDAGQSKTTTSKVTPRKRSTKNRKSSGHADRTQSPAPGGTVAPQMNPTNPTNPDPMRPGTPPPPPISTPKPGQNPVKPTDPTKVTPAKPLGQ
jgi:hypothetical protein